MNAHREIEGLAEIVIVRVLTPADPYSAGDVLSIAFTRPGIGRLRRHDGRCFADEPSSGVPEIMTVTVLHAAGPYQQENVLTLAFVDPSLARIASIDSSWVDARVTARSLSFVALNPAILANADTDVPAASQSSPTTTSADRLPLAEPLSITVRLRWTEDRVRRFIQVCDKLFTVERLGWYRHALVLRLLVPDSVDCADATVRAEAGEKLETLRAAVTDTLGNPLLAAFMPNFSVTPGWLESLESAELARALAAFRGFLAPHAGELPPHALFGHENIEETVGQITASELNATPFACSEAGLALLVPHISPVPSLAEPLGAYRTKTAELFGQMADTPERARIKQMSQTNLVLDDQLWQLVSAVQLTFEPAPAA